jgi:hypothetical protein
VIVTITKFTHGAWLVFLAIPLLSFLMIGVHRYYRDVEHEIAMDDDVHFGATGDVAIVLVGTLQKPSRRRSTTPCRAGTTRRSRYTSRSRRKKPATCRRTGSSTTCRFRSW